MVFARAIVAIRDTAISSCGTAIAATTVGDVAERWRAALAGAEVESVRRSLIPDVVDSTIFALLNAIENDDLELFIRNPDSGAFLSLSDVGRWEMAGDYIGDDGWREAYSSHPVNFF